LINQLPTADNYSIIDNERKRTMSNNNSSGGIGLAGALAIVFITLKLVDVIDWSWWWVLSPIWIPWVLAR